jgi:hypothetical protein
MLRSLLVKFGGAAFLFFLVKGIAWLVAFWFGIEFLMQL